MNIITQSTTFTSPEATTDHHSDTIDLTELIYELVITSEAQKFTQTADLSNHN